MVKDQFEKIKQWQHAKTDNDFLLWTKIDKQGDLTMLMANKLHEAGIINGDLEDLQKNYRAADEKFEDHVHKLAAEVLRK